MNAKNFLLFTVLCLALQAFPFSAPGEDLVWPQWRGPTRDGIIAKGAPWPKKISKKMLKQTWRREISKGYPGPIVSEKLVFTVETKGKNEFVRAFDRSSGEQKWEAQWPGSMSVPFFAWKNGSWVRSTPAYDGKNLYVGGMRDFLVCLDASNGSQKWSVDLMKRYKAPLPAFGFVCSPLVEGDHIYVQAGAGFVKLKSETGESVWRTLDDKGGMYGSAFSSPTTAKLGGIEQLVVQTRTELTGVEPDNGKVLWKRPIKAFRGMNILTPVIFGQSVFTSSYGGKSLLFDLAKDANGFSIDQKWENKQEGYMSSPIVIDGFCYIHLRKQRMTCIDLSNGATKWISSESFGKYQSMVSNGKEILALDEDGTLYQIEANPEKLVIKDKRTISDSPTWAHLAIAGNQLFVRELEAIACYEW
ncbi:MAG TPA: pyrrolo-quinoline quinone [Opitutae bacterium]|nr:pyrrolo-quinoline quinone [Opitutae bacterium]|tara:strand:+ start:1211 stop:2458 length:1248 start_codon:yes stop_codon:yes gene_type:complete